MTSKQIPRRPTPIAPQTVRRQSVDCRTLSRHRDCGTSLAGVCARVVNLRDHAKARMQAKGSAIADQ
jgi:hypothetical protein